MGGGDAARQAQILRERAASLLQDATRCTDPARRDALLSEALTRLDEARRLLDQLEAERPGANRSTARMH